MGALRSDVFKIFFYVVATLLLGAALTPVVFNVGMALAEVTEGRETNGFLNWLGDAAMRSKDNYPRFFARALLLAGLLLLGPLTAWLRLGGGRERYRDTPWSLRLPDSAVAMDRGQPLEKARGGWAQGLFGFMLAAGILLLSGWMLVRAGFFMWRDAAEGANGSLNPVLMNIEWGKEILDAIPRALVVGLTEEVLFRGILLGIFLRSMKPARAIIALSLLFAFVHFLKPVPGTRVPDPEALNAGFVLLGQILSRFAEPFPMVGRFLVLTAVGVVLGLARWRTASLWLPIGLHVGWVFALALFKAATWPVRDLPEEAHWLVGVNILEGLLPLVLVVMTGMLVVMSTRPRDESVV